MKGTVLITGVSTGIGKGLVPVFLERGYRVFGSLRQGEAASLAARAWGPDFTPLLFDVTEASSVEKAVEVLQSRLKGGGLDILINNAGISFSTPLAEVSAASLREHFAVNVEGAHRVTQAFLPFLEKGGPGRKIINISTLAAMICSPFTGPYAASKTALEALSHVWRRELRPWGLPVVIIRPGSVESPIWEKGQTLERCRGSRWEKELQRFTLLGRRGLKRGYTAEAFARRVVKIAEMKRPPAVVTLSRDPVFLRIFAQFLSSALFDAPIGGFLGLKR